MEFLRYFWEQKITPKKQSWSPRHVEKMMHYTSQKIAPFQALISSKLHSVQSWHLFCQPKTVSFTNPQVHGPPNPLLYRELDCIQIVIWPAQAILGLFTDLHPGVQVSKSVQNGVRRPNPKLYAVKIYLTKVYSK